MTAKKILVVDDDPDIIELITMVLQNKGYQLNSALNGHQALEILEQETPPELIITDVLMPEMDGYTFYKELKRDENFAKLPVIILTERKNMEDSFRALGVEGFLQKPFSIENLTSQVEAILENAVAARKFAQKVLIAGTIGSVISRMNLQLKDMGCQVASGTTGAQAAFQAMSLLPDMFLVDVTLDNFFAHEFVRVMRYFPQFKKTPILIYNNPQHAEELTTSAGFQAALSLDSAKVVCMEAGATECVGEFNEAALMGIISRYF